MTSELIRDAWFGWLAAGRRRAADRRRRASEAGVTLAEVDAADEAARALLWERYPGAALYEFGRWVRVEVFDKASRSLREMADAMCRLGDVPVLPVLRLRRQTFDRSLAVASRLPPRPPRDRGRERRRGPFWLPRGGCGRRP